MTRVPENPPAFPRPFSKTDGGARHGPESYHKQDGMSLRDYFAGQALMGMLASGHQEAIEKVKAVTGNNLDGLAYAAYGFADAMLKAREVK